MFVILLEHSLLSFYIVWHSVSNVDAILIGLHRFLNQIQIHLNLSFPHLIRYGSVLIVHGLLSQWPDLIDQIPELFSSIINTCCDRYQSTREISLSILYQIGVYRQLHALVDLIQLYESRHNHWTVGSTAIAGLAPPPVSRSGTAPKSLRTSSAVRPVLPVRHTITLSDVLGEAVMYGPNLSSVQLTSLLTSSRYTTDKIQLDMLYLVCHWAKRAQEHDPHL